ncbi:MAG: DUF2341 domain-containing protein, partial [Verrucomicrobiota bacterium]
MVATLLANTYLVSTTAFDTVTIVDDDQLIGFNYSMDIRFCGYDRAETLTNFPVLIILGSNLTNFAYSQFSSSAGGDLRFSDSTLTNPIPHEIESWNTNGLSYVWVQVPALVDSNTTIRAFWGHPQHTNQPAYTTNGTTWPLPYEAVWHLNETVADEATTGTHFDSTAFLRHGGQSGNDDVGTAFPGGQRFDGNDLIDFAGWSLSGDQLTMSAWFRPEINAPNGTLIGKSHANTHVNPWYKWALWYNGAANTAHVRIDTTAFNGPGGAVIENTWNQMAAVYDGAFVRLYLNGNEVGNAPKTGFLQASTQRVRIGGRDTVPLAEYFQGDLDEIRLATAARSADWIWAAWYSSASNGFFNCYSPVSPA